MVVNHQIHFLFQVKESVSIISMHLLSFYKRLEIIFYYKEVKLKLHKSHFSKTMVLPPVIPFQCAPKMTLFIMFSPILPYFLNQISYSHVIFLVPTLGI